MSSSVTASETRGGLDLEPKRRLLAERVRARRARERWYPVSRAQRRLWVQDRLDPGGTTYNQAVAVRVRGPLRIDALEEALAVLPRRHAVLRTRFEEREGHPWQVVEPPSRLPLERRTLDPDDGELRDRQVQAAVRDELSRPFDLTRAPLLRVTLLEASESDGVLVLGVHHIAADGWSIPILFRDLVLAYRDLAAGRAPGGVPLAISYGDFARAEESRGPEPEAGLRYWETVLRGSRPTEVPRDAVAAGGTGPRAQPAPGFAQTLDRSLREGQCALARAHAATPFMVLGAALSAVLMQRSGSDEAVMGTDVANRAHPDTRELVGFFVNQLVLRTRLVGDPTAVELLHEVRRTCLDAYAHQDVPFDEVVRAVEPRRRWRRSPLFRIKYGFQRIPTVRFDLDELRFELLDLPPVAAVFDLVFYAYEWDDGLLLKVWYDDTLYLPATVAALLDDWVFVLDRVVKDPALRVRSLVEELERRERQRGKTPARDAGPLVGGVLRSRRQKITASSPARADPENAR